MIRIERLDLSGLSSMKIDNLKSVKKTKVNTDITPVSLNKEIPKSLIDVDYSEESNGNLTKFFDDPFSNLNNNNNNTAIFNNPLGGIQSQKKEIVSELNSWKDIKIIPIEKSKFTTQLENYQNERQKVIDIYSNFLKEANLKLKEIEKSRTILENEASSISLHETRIEETIRNRAIEFQTMGLSEETQKNIGLTMEQAKNMNVDELIVYLKNNDDYTKEMLNGLKALKKDLNEQVKELTNFSNYEEFNEYVMGLDQDKAVYESGIHQLERSKKIAKYNMLANTEEFRNFNSDKKYGYFDQLADDAIQDNIRYKNLLETEDETLIKMYSYLYETEGVGSASKYLSDIEDNVNQVIGQKNAEEFLNQLVNEENVLDALYNHLNVTGQGTGDGVLNFIQGMKEIILPDKVYTVHDYETMYTKSE